MTPADIPRAVVTAILYEYREASENQVRGILAEAIDQGLIILDGSNELTRPDDWPPA